MTVHDGNVSISKLVTLALWTWTLCVLLGAWTAWFYGSGTLWMMLGFTACASSAVAATAQIRCYSLGVCALLNGRSALEDEARRVRNLHR